MTRVSSLSDQCMALVLDSSVIVNLNATGYADRVLSALSVDVYVPNPVVKELQRGAAAGHSDAIDLHTLLEKKIVRELPLTGAAPSEFVALVSGATVTTLGDGEAATIACAHETGAWAVIDERKARRICEERYQSVGLLNTVDLLSYGKVEKSLSTQEMSKAVFAALEVANMQVYSHHLNWVLGHLDPSLIHRCPSLPRVVREKVVSKNTKALRA